MKKRTYKPTLIVPFKWKKFACLLCKYKSPWKKILTDWRTEDVFLPIILSAKSTWESIYKDIFDGQCEEESSPGAKWLRVTRSGLLAVREAGLGKRYHSFPSKIKETRPDCFKEEEEVQCTCQGLARGQAKAMSCPCEESSPHEYGDSWWRLFPFLWGV